MDRWLVTLRYISLMLGFASVGMNFNHGFHVGIYFVITYLIFVINNQVRFFILNENRYFFIFSIGAEFVLSLIIALHYGGILFLLSFCSLMDLAMSAKSSYLALIYSFILSALLITLINTSTIMVFVEILSIFAVGILGSYIKGEKDRKVEAQELYDKLRVSEEELKSTKDELERYASTIEEITLLRERNRISREIHDSVGHSLSTMIIQLSAVERVSQSDGRAASEMANNLAEFAKSALKDVRIAVNALKPREFEKYQGVLAIEEMIKNYKKLTDIEVIFTLSKEKWELNQDQSFILYRVIQEFLTNAARHGRASRVNINLNFFRDHIYVRLKDNGAGCDKVVEGMGLKSIRERVESGGGEIKYNSSTGNGFELTFNLPRIESLVKEKSINGED